MAYLIVNRVIGIVFLLGFVFFCCAVAAVQWSNIKQDFSVRNRRRKLKKAAVQQTRKGLRR